MIADELIKLRETKASIKQALIDKGQNPTDEFASYANDISNITSGGGVSFPEGTKFAYSKFTELTPEMKSYVENCSDCSLMFMDSSLTGELSLNLKATDISLMFYNGPNNSIAGYPINTTNKLTSVSLNLLNEASAIGLFSGCVGLKNITINGSVSDCSIMFGSSSVTSVSGELDTSNCENFGTMFNRCEGLKTVPNLNTSNGTRFDYMFGGCYQITSIPALNVFNGTNFGNMFAYCTSLQLIPALITNQGINFSGMVTGCSKLVKITEISAESARIELSLMSSYTSNTSTRYILVKDIGTRSTCTSVNFKGFTNYGIERDDISLSEGARQSLIDTLITYSYDRATAGYNTCNVTLSTNTKALLTEDEIAQITAKGYTIA